MSVQKTIQRVVLLVAILAFLSPPAQADSLENWKRVVGVDGCPGIPYMDLARRCMDTMVDVHEWCKQIKWSCKGGEVPSIRTAREEAANLNTDIRNKERELDQENDKLRNDQDAEKRKNIEKTIDDLKRYIAGQREKVQAANEREVGARKETELRLSFGTKCLSLRDAVMKFFAEALERGDRESDAEIKTIYNDKKKDKWRSDLDEHKRAMSDVTDGIRACQDWLDGR